MVTLIILDGWGIAPPSRGNAISQANTQNIDQYIQNYPAMAIQAAGEVVGLPWAEVGNSEVGHLNLGSGQIIYQNLPLINRAITDGNFFQNKAFLKAIEHAKKNDSAIHLMGLVSDGGVHSSQDHLYALLELCQQQQLQKVYIHAFLDGRDTEKNGALNFLAKLQTKLQEIGTGKIATLCGRKWAMDRDNHWEHIKKAYDAIVAGEAENKAMSPLAAIEMSYQKKVFDEEFPATVLTEEDKPVATVDKNDAVIFFNFRADRARQMTKAFVLPTFDKFERKEYLDNLVFITMTEYEQNLPITIAFQPNQVTHPLARIISEAGMKQLHIAETEKYAHVTVFFNGGKEDAFEGEERVIVPSPQISSYDQQPAMSSLDLKDRLIKEIQSKKFDFIVANFANADMVGHTGNLEAAKKAVEAVDKAMAEVIPAVMEQNGTVILTADHGNAEEMINLQTGEVLKEHTINPVPCVIIGKQWAARNAEYPAVPGADLSQLQPSGILADVAPTILQIMEMAVPENLMGHSLIHQ